MTDLIRVLHVDDDSAFVEMAAEMLEQQADDITVTTATGADDGLDRLADEDIDCIVSDYDMPGRNGIEFLETIRDTHPRLPFILFTGKGSEEVASEAISAGVTDYLQKERGTDQYAILANRVRNAVERTRAQTQRERQLNAIETAQAGISILDENGRFTYVNEAYANLYRYDPEDLIGKHWNLLYPNDEVQHVHDDILPIVEASGYWRGETTGLRADGSTFIEDHVLASAAEDSLICTVRDISDRRRREQERKQERERFAAIFEAIPEPVVHVRFDANTTPIVQNVNAAFEEVFGYKTDDLRGESLNDAIVLDDSRKEAHEMDQLAQAQDVVEQGVQRETIDGQRVFLFRGTQFDVADKKESIGVYVDITEQYQRKQELERQNERLDEFASILAHDLQNPLNVAMGRLELAQNEFQSDHLDALAQAHERIESLIDDLLTLAQDGNRLTDVEPVELRYLVETCWQTVETRDATLVTETDQTIQADPGRIQQLFENLVRNAVEHGGPAVTITVGDLDDETGFYVADDGVGIPSGERERVFNYGYSTHDDGTGLGLAIVEQIVEAHGWDIEVTSGADDGTRFNFYWGGGVINLF